MPQLDLLPPPGAAATPPARPVALCVCGHPVERHDAVAKRYCGVTVSANLDRGCVCR